MVYSCVPYLLGGTARIEQKDLNLNDDSFIDQCFVVWDVIRGRQEGSRDIRGCETDTVLGQ